MKKDNNRLVFGLLALVLFLGVGYAVVSGIGLTIAGSATTKETELDVYFSDADITELTDVTTTASVGTGDKPLTASFSVSDLSNLTQSVTATFTIKNDETDLDAKVSLNTMTNSNDEFFSVSTSLDSDATIIVPAGSTNTFTITISLNKIPTEEDILANEDAGEATINVTLDADPIQPS